MIGVKICEDSRRKWRKKRSKGGKREEKKSFSCSWLTKFAVSVRRVLALRPPPATSGQRSGHSGEGLDHSLPLDYAVTMGESLHRLPIMAETNIQNTLAHM